MALTETVLIMRDVNVRRMAVRSSAWLGMPHRATNCAESRNDIVEGVNAH